jgi:hypothetical protein
MFEASFRRRPVYLDNRFFFPYNRKAIEPNKKRGVAQLVARLLWEQDVAGSNPVTSTKQRRARYGGSFSV